MNMSKYDIRVVGQEVASGSWKLRIEADNFDEAQQDAVSYVSLGLETGKLELESEGIFFKIEDISENQEESLPSNIELLTDNPKDEEVTVLSRISALPTR
jgi:hypothetical protein